MWTQDFRFALRQFKSGWGYTLVAVVTLALGIGANTALFTVIDSVLLRPLPYAHADRLIYIAPKTDKEEFTGTSWLNYCDIRDQATALQATAGYASDVSVVETKDATLSVAAPRVTPSLFPMLAVQPLLGRSFTEAEGQSGGPPVVLLSEGLWRQNFNADREIVGKTVKIGGVGRTVIGIMPQTMHFPDETGPDVQKAIWLPLQPTQEMLTDRGYNFFNVVAQLRPGKTQSQLQAELDTVAQHIRREDSHLQSNFGFRATLYQQLLTHAVRPVFLALLGALALVLLISCANVANLLIARCLGRQQEFAVRVALGASRFRLIRQLFVEGGVLSLLGAGLGLLLAKLALEGVRKLPEGTIPRADTITIRWSVILALAAIATTTTLLSSLLPALLAGRTDPQAGLQAGTRSLGPRSVRGRLSGWLTAGEVALSTVLLIGTGLLFRTLWNLEHAELGFAVSRVTTFTAMPDNAAGFTGMTVSHDTANAPVSIATLTYAPILERIRHLPGVENAAFVSIPPLSGSDLHSDFKIIGQPEDPNNRPTARVTAASEEYARTLGTPVVRGRTIDEHDTADAPPVAVINESFAKAYFPNKDPLQQQIDLGGKGTGMLKPLTIVGVLANQVDSNVGGTPDPLIILPYQQVPTTSLFYQALIETMGNFVVKTRGNLAVAAAMRSVFHEGAPNLALDNFKTMQEMVDDNIFSQRLGLYLTGAFAGLAVVMVIAGLYGVLAQLVSYRRHEIGVRMALGATRQGVLTMVLRQGALIIGIGLAAGMLLALAMGQLLRSFLYQVHPADLWTYVVVSLILLAIGFVASMLPARRAASIEPMQALREE
jgi:putative ABC transport system permease protein